MTFSSSSRMRTESCSTPHTSTLLMPCTASRRGMTTLSIRKSVRAESPGCRIPKKAIGIELPSSDQM